MLDIKYAGITKSAVVVMSLLSIVNNNVCMMKRLAISLTKQARPIALRRMSETPNARQLKSFVSNHQLTRNFSKRAGDLIWFKSHRGYQGQQGSLSKKKPFLLGTGLSAAYFSDANKSTLIECLRKYEKDRIEEIEKKEKRDIAAFLESVAESDSFEMQDVLHILLEHQAYKVGGIETEVKEAIPILFRVLTEKSISDNSGTADAYPLQCVLKYKAYDIKGIKGQVKEGIIIFLETVVKNGSCWVIEETLEVLLEYKAYNIKGIEGQVKENIIMLSQAVAKKKCGKIFVLEYLLQYKAYEIEGIEEKVKKEIIKLLELISNVADPELMGGILKHLFKYRAYDIPGISKQVKKIMVTFIISVAKSNHHGLIDDMMRVLVAYKAWDIDGIEEGIEHIPVIKARL